MRLVALNVKLTEALAEVRAQMARRYPTSREYRIALRPDDRGDDPLSYDTVLDDIVVNNVPMFRAEQMDRNRWWVACYLDSDTSDRICWSVRAASKPLRIEWTTTEFPSAATYEHEARP